jgi:hypothetical protein
LRVSVSDEERNEYPDPFVDATVCRACNRHRPPPPSAGQLNYFLYNDESLLIFTKTYRTWGPFYYRDNLERLTVTVRSRNETQLVVRASAQYYMRAVENPEPYQGFFRTLEQAVFADRELAR